MAFNDAAGACRGGRRVPTTPASIAGDPLTQAQLIFGPDGSDRFRSVARRRFDFPQGAEEISSMKRIVPVLAVAAAALAFSLPPASAAGPYDGTWVINAPAAGGEAGSTGSESGCEAVRFELKVADNKISGNLRRAVTGQARVESDASGTPLTGTVEADGTLAAQWESYKITGKFNGNKVEVHWKGQCGARVGTGGKAS